MWESEVDSDEKREREPTWLKPQPRRRPLPRRRPPRRSRRPRSAPPSAPDTTRPSRSGAGPGRAPGQSDRPLSVAAHKDDFEAGDHARVLRLWLFCGAVCGSVCRPGRTPCCNRRFGNVPDYALSSLLDGETALAGRRSYGAWRRMRDKPRRGSPAWLRQGSGAAAWTRRRSRVGTIAAANRATEYASLASDRKGRGAVAHTERSTISFLISAMAFAGLRPLGQALVQFRMVWQR